MLGVLRKRVACGGLNNSISGQWLQTVRSPRIYSPVREEIILHSRRHGHVRSFCHFIVLGRSSSRTRREVACALRSEANIQISSRLFSSDSGDLVDAVVPFMGESITDGTLAIFLKKPGDSVQVDEPIAQVETDKVTIDVASPEAGVIQKFVAKEGDTVEPGTKVAVISKSGEGVAHVAPSEKKSDEVTPESSPPKPKNDSEIEKNKAVQSPVSEKPKAPSPSPPPPPPSPTKRSPIEPQLPPKERERRVPMTRLRKRVATRLKDSQNTFAMLTTFNEVDI